MSTANDASPIKLPKFLVSTVEPKSRDGDQVVFDRYSKQTGELPLFLVDVKYEDKATVAAEWDQIVEKTEDHDGTKIKRFVDEGKGDFSGTEVSQAEFTALLAKEGKQLLFYLHGMGQQTKQMVEATDSLQTEFDSQKQEKVLVVPVDWAADDDGGQLGRMLGRDEAPAALRYFEDKENAKLAGSALWKLFTCLKKEMGSEQTLSLNVMAHSMGNRVFRCMGKEAVKGDTSWNEEGLVPDKSLLQAAPKDLKDHENLFDNFFFVAADIPESAFDAPDGQQHSEEMEHALQSGVAALAVMTKGMHVLHGNGTDEALNSSFFLNPTASRLGSRGPWSDGILGLGQHSTKVWNKIGDALDVYEEKGSGSVNNGNVHVKDCSAWNKKNSPNGHSYQFAPETVDYYLKHMTKTL